jgi:hypothetical protein
LSSELLVVTNLLLNLCNGCLKSGLLQGLSFLVRIDDLLSNEVVQGFAWVLSDDGVDLGCRVLFNKQSIVSILIIRYRKLNHMKQRDCGTYQLLDGIAQAPRGAIQLASRVGQKPIASYALLQLLQNSRLSTVRLGNGALRLSLGGARSLGGLLLGLVVGFLSGGGGGSHDGMW